jgi:hypothetical protein
MRYAGLWLGLLVWSGVAGAQPLKEPLHDPALAPLRQMLAELPAALIGPGVPDWPLLQFGDVAGALALPPEGADPGLRAFRGWPLFMMQHELSELGVNWAATVGFTPRDVAQALMHSTVSGQTHLFRLAPGVAGQTGAALAGAGYAAQGQAGQTWLRAGDDGQIDPQGAPAGDPFRGRLGMAAHLRIDGDVIRHAPTAAAMAALVAPGQAPASAAPDVGALLTGLSGLEAGPLLRATLMLQVMPFLAHEDPRAALGLDSGPPQRWQALALADFSDGTTATAVLALVLPVPAGQAPAQITDAVLRRWSEWPRAGDLAQVVPDAGFVPAGAGISVFRLALSTPEEAGHGGIGRNPAFEVLSRALMLGEFGFLPGAR